MHPSLRLCAAGTSGTFRRPLIHFIGKRQWPSTPKAPHPHPAAPADIKNAFSDFVKKLQSSAPAEASSKSQGASKEDVQVFDEFWQAPERLWKHGLEDWEVELVMSGGASVH
ncbi:hypothetical protein AcW1_004100 [Taiwanofungus camphoratus]|nr:hypothetical protein AcW2_006894 [Antrodia cinnamomea]KAI0938916.1 hypothetical protein AcV5_000479 [Antrodia cinnamomea]KAI0951830.1 hypothetical protein AcV7_007820 [Antrodia cinnamomea]KAI0959200.1 hypothetical protein AcW1_004100 [Antrodia cinnamomea]